MALVSLDEVQAAAKRIAGHAVRTPLLPLGDDLWLKPENLQPVGAFKIRGAMHALTPHRRSRSSPPDGSGPRWSWGHIPT